MPRSAWSVMGALLALVVVAGCGTEPAGSGPDRLGLGAGDSLPTPTPSEPLTDEPVPESPQLPSESIATLFGWPAESEVALAYCPDPEPDHLPAGVIDAELFVCGTERRAVAGDGTWEFAVVRKVTGGAGALLAAYATPDDDPSTGGACTLELPSPLIVWVDTGEIHTVRAPVDSCGKPVPAAIAAYDGLSTEIVAEERLEQVSSELADRTGCYMTWTDMIAYEADAPSGTPPRSVADLPLDADRACTYAVAPGRPQDKEQATLTAARLLDETEQAAIDAALADSVEDPTCARVGHTSFVMLWPDRSDKIVYVALDGCAVQLDGSWWRATDELRALLSA